MFIFPIFEHVDCINLKFTEQLIKKIMFNHVQSNKKNSVKVRVYTGKSLKYFFEELLLGTGRVAQWIRRLPTEQEIPGSIPGTFRIKGEIRR